jgi:Flp pilus assembly secretin CpaC
MRPTALLVLVAVAAALPAAAADLSVRKNQSTAIRLSAPARDVVIGNPTIADVSVLDRRSLVVVGKSYGVTNLLVMDHSGRTILNRQIVVSGAADADMTYYQGTEQRSYACADRCERIGENSSQ